MDNSFLEMLSKMFNGFQGGAQNMQPTPKNPAFDNYPSELQTKENNLNANSSFSQNAYPNSGNQNFNSQTYNPSGQGQQGYQNTNNFFEQNTNFNQNLPFNQNSPFQNMNNNSNQNFLSMLLSMMGGKNLPNFAQMMSTPKEDNSSEKSESPPNDELLL